jgi:hypothetical protein
MLRHAAIHPAAIGKTLDFEGFSVVLLTAAAISG